MKRKDNTTKSPSSTPNSNNSNDSPNLWSVCGLTSAILVPECGESMLSKVTTLFAAPTSSTKAADADDKDNDNDPVTLASTESTGADAAAEEQELAAEATTTTTTASMAAADADADVVPAAKPTKNKKKSPGIAEGEDAPDTPTRTKKSTKKKTNSDAAKSPTTTKKKNKAPKSKSSTSTEDPTSPSSTGGSDAQLEEEDVDAMLANLEIPDFSMSMMDIPEDQDAFDDDSNNINNKKNAWEKVDWKQRVTRDEVFSKRYKPKQAEQQELEAMAQVLGLAKSSDLFSLGKRMSMSIGMGSKVTEDIHKLFFGGHSILLSMLQVQWNGTPCELLLLTDGFVLKYKNFNSYNPLEKRYETCQLWDAVDFCERSGHFTVTIQLVEDAAASASSTSYELEAVSSEEGGESLDTILGHLERVITHHDLLSGHDRTDTLGWQYLRIRKTAFTAAVKNDPELLVNKKQAAKGINDLDAYNHYAPLHYAILQDECNVDVIKGLLKAGADPNLEDADGRSPMYYAERNELPEEILKILQSGGGQKSKLADMEMRGKLFSGVEGANANAEKRRELERVVKENEQAMRDQKAAEAQAKAEGAQSEMSKAMSALIERGEKIERMGETAKELNAEAKTFGDLAAKLKDEVKSKKWYQL